MWKLGIEESAEMAVVGVGDRGPAPWYCLAAGLQAYSTAENNGRGYLRAIPPRSTFTGQRM